MMQNITIFFCGVHLEFLETTESNLPSYVHVLQSTEVIDGLYRAAEKYNNKKRKANIFSCNLVFIFSGNLKEISLITFSTLNIAFLTF